MSGSGPTAGREVGAGAPAAPTAGAAVAVRVEAVALPDALLARLGRALLLAGTVAGTRPDGTFLIRTRIGEVAVRSATPLPLGRPVSLQIPAQVGEPAPVMRSPLSVVLLVPAATPVATSARTAAEPSPTGTLPTPPPPMAAPPGTTIAGRAPPVPGPGTPPPTVASPSQPGAAAASSPLVSAPLHAPAIAQPSAPPPPVSGTAQSLDPPPAARATTARTVATGAGPAATPQLSPAQAGAPVARPPPSLTASVGALAKALDAGPAAAAIAAHRPLPIETAPPPPPPAPPFPALRDTISALAQLDPALAHEVVRTALPKPDGRLAPTLLAFVAAIRGGDVRSWLGDRAVRALDAAGKGEVVARLAAELSFGERGAAPQPNIPAADWRPQPFPMLHGGEIVPVQLWLHRSGEPDDDDGSQAARGRPGARFLIDLELSRLGPLQLDGLMKERRFDLILRSERSLARTLRHELLGIFAAACETVNLTGTLAFHPGTQGWVRLARRNGPTAAVTA